MSNQWFRSWHGAPTDAKWLLISRRAGVCPGMVSFTFWALLDYASQHADRGSVNGFDVETFALWAGWDESDIHRIIDELRRKGVIDGDDRLAAWDERQPKREDNNSTERVRAFRERNAGSRAKQSDVLPENVTHGNSLKRNATLDQIRSDKETTTTTQTQQILPATNGNHLISGAAQLQSDDGATAFAAVVKCYQENMPGLLSQIIADDLGDLVATYGADNVIRAIIESARSNGRSIRYVTKVLENWATGKGKPTSQANGVFTSSGEELIGKMLAETVKL